MPTNMLTSPRFRESELGLPMPDDPHAVSACLPLWQHNIGYEEGDSAVHSKLQAAYPRFCFHPMIKQLCLRFLDDEQYRGLPFVSPTVACRAKDYLRFHGVTSITTIPLGDTGMTGVVVSKDDFSTLKQYWQHAGENVSSRMAEQFLSGNAVTFTKSQARQTIRDRFADIQNTASENVYLYSSGMSAIASAWRMVLAHRPGTTCQFGFPYVDTLKIQQRFRNAQHMFLAVGNEHDLTLLETQCATNPPVAVFCEAPTNPLLVTPDLVRLQELAQRHDMLLVVDDTLGACGNVNVLPLADIVVTSLTKYFSGAGNVLAGALTLNPAGRYAQQLAAILNSEFEETLSDIDTEVLCTNSADYRQRVSLINSNAATLADFLRRHAAVKSVFYPSPNDPTYASIRSKQGGFGGLMSMELHDAANRTPQMFDRLEVCKGPNLGTSFTLCCPYTILAHYDELDFVESCGVSRWLLRISVGTEPAAELISRFQNAMG